MIVAFLMAERRNRLYSTVMETERRSRQRFRLSRMGVYDIARERYICAQGSDISRGGMSFVADEYVQPGTAVWLSFSIPEPDGSWLEIDAEGIVANVSDLATGCRFGVVFSRMTPEDRSALEAFADLLEAGELEQ